MTWCWLWSRRIDNTAGQGGYDVTVIDGRYKALCEATWPNYRGSGSSRDAVELICQQLNYDDDDYRLGRLL